MQSHLLVAINLQTLLKHFEVPQRAWCIDLLQFNELWHLLVDWMTEVEQTLDTHKEIAATQEEIKQQLGELKVYYI